MEVVGAFIAQGRIGERLKTEDMSVQATPIDFPGGRLICLLKTGYRYQFQPDRAEVSDLDIGQFRNGNKVFQIGYDFKELLTNIHRYIPDDKTRSKKLMIINDNPDLISVMTTTLKEYGYEVISAPEGMIRVDDIHKKKPDLILLDIDMLEDWGITVFKILKKSDATMSIPVVLTANQLSPDELKELAAQLGAEAYVTESDGLEEIIPEIEKIFDK